MIGLRELYGYLDIYSEKYSEREPFEFAMRAITEFDIDPIIDYFTYERWGFPRDPSDQALLSLTVDPNEIRHDLVSFLPIRGENAVIGCGGGSWDEYTVPFDETDLYRAIERRFIDGVPWEETEKYQRAKKKVQYGQRTWNGCTSVEDIDERCREIERLYRTVATEGYRSQSELRANDEVVAEDAYTRQVGGRTVPNEVRIGIGRDGTLIRCACGRHRLAIAQVLDVDEIPVLVQIRHSEWNGSLPKTNSLEASDQLSNASGGD